MRDAVQLPAKREDFEQPYTMPGTTRDVFELVLAQDVNCSWLCGAGDDRVQYSQRGGSQAGYCQAPKDISSYQAVHGITVSGVLTLRKAAT